MRFSKFFRTETRKSELDEEIAAHLAMAAADRRDRGADAATARQEAQREFGNTALIKDVTSQTWVWPWFERLQQDLKYALRQMRKSPGFAASVIGTLALGIAAATAMFTVVDRMLLEPVRYHDAGRLVSISVGDAQNAYGVAWLEFEQWQKESRAFEQMALSGSMGRHNYLHGKTDLLEVSGRRVSANMFSTLGIEPELGRGFLPEAPGFAPGKNAERSYSAMPCGGRLSARTGRFLVDR